ncbi:DUF3891 family protein [Evansella sp. AB-P1]|uniref:DUF3891 family protein n=1 Tax=Evansella sp. AB-P1 TaxID=3037653 RepID=UPI00241E0EA6|nr:DUF3891 family protein [Evansella sp. AB-P1]MDG5789939.1 DUF3891 family protein [Evansella sp. AB-P1]
MERKMYTIAKLISKWGCGGMIVQEDYNDLILIQQHDHALISGTIANAWNENYFKGEGRRESVELAIAQHDSCWKKLDEKPIYLASTKQPASFLYYPLKEKITAYSQGVDEMEKKNKLAALLISMHYSSFFQGNLDQEGEVFKSNEKDRQKNLWKELIHGSEEREEVKFYFDLLQLCDNLSLYLCMNKWGCSKEEELSWFKNGFPQQLTSLNGVNMVAEWRSPSNVKLTPYPFTEDQVEVHIPYKKIQKECINRYNLKDEIDSAELKKHKVTFACDE